MNSLAICLSVLMVFETCMVYAGDSVSVGKNEQDKEVSYKSREENLKEQLEYLYKSIGEKVDLPYTYVKAMHLIAGGQAIYSDRSPNIMIDETVESLSGPFEIDGVYQMYDKHYMENQSEKQEHEDLQDKPVESIINNKGILSIKNTIPSEFDTIHWKETQEEIEEIQYIQEKTPSKYSLPDASYNVMCTIKAIMEERSIAQRGNMQVYFDSLLPDVKQNILFYEAVMQYCGYSESEINALYKAYERIVYLKERNEYVVELTSDGHYNIKDKFLSVFDRYNIKVTEPLAIAMSFDAELAEWDTPTGLKSDVPPLHYKVDYTSRENMMVAAMSLVGKVRYVWGGGHGGTSNINGINPIWACFNELYSSEINVEGEEIRGDNSLSCIQPAGTWCPIHGSLSGQCSLSDIRVKTLDEYLSLRGKEISDTSAYAYIKGKDLSNIFINNNLAYSNNIEAHRVEGLDCSGFASWLYNQIDDTRVYDSSARNFVNTHGLESLEFGEELLPGDVIAWSSHICVVVGKLDETAKVYLQVESTPNVIKLGVAYYPGATQEQINEAKELAKEANMLLGNVQDPYVSVYNIKDLVYTAQVYVEQPVEEEGQIEQTEKTKEEGQTQQTDQQAEKTDKTEQQSQPEEKEYNMENVSIKYTKTLGLGRLPRPYKDEDEIVGGYGKTMNQMTAREILQNTIDALPIEYLSGIASYKGGTFNVK